MKLDKNFLGIVVVLIAAGAVSMMLYFRQLSDSDSAKVSTLPMEIADWKGKDIPLDERTYRILETKNLLMREYKSPENQSVYLYMVVSEVNRRVVHPPEVCYTGDGNEISEKEQVEINIPGFGKPFALNSFVSMKGSMRESLVYYCYKSGDKFTTDYITQQANMVLSNVMGKYAPGALVRISTSIVNNDKEKAAQILQEFSKEVFPLIRKSTQ
ncbi:MAG: exosortase C-terminal domain/associated protein EpsI [bacterium]